MFNLWSFSQTSNLLLKQCLEAATPPEPSNKWVQAFRSKDLDANTKKSPTSECPVSEDTHTSVTTKENLNKDTFYETEDCVMNFDDFRTECLNDHKKASDYAQKLPVNIIEDLLRNIFETTHIEEEFLKLFFSNFVINYIKHDNSRSCTELLLKIHTTFPQHFKIVLKLLINDPEVPSNILSDFIQLLDADRVTRLLISMSSIEMTAAQFIHNIFAIYTAYKMCSSTKDVHHFVFDCLKMFGNSCTDDKNYGRLMLLYLQREKSLKLSAEYNGTLLKLLETHKSAFRKPCLTILQELNS